MRQIIVPIRAIQHPDPGNGPPSGIFMNPLAEEAAFMPLGADRPDSARRAVVLAAHDRARRVLLQLRDADRPIVYPGWWGMFGGEIEPGETIAAAGRREFREETGLDLADGHMAPLGWIASRWPGGGRLFALRITVAIEPRDLQLAEGAGFAFFTAAQLPDLRLAPECRPVLAAAAAQLGPPHRL